MHERASYGESLAIIVGSLALRVYSLSFKCPSALASFPGLPLLEGKNKGEEGLVKLIST